MNDEIYVELLEKIASKIESDRIIKPKGGEKHRFILICKNLKGTKPLKQAQLKNIYKLMVEEPSFSANNGQELFRNIIDLFWRYVSAIHSPYMKKFNIKIKLLNEFSDLSEIEDYLADINSYIENNPDGFDELTFLYEDNRYKILLADDKELFQEVFEGETNWCVVNTEGYWEDYTNKGILILFEDKSFRFKNKNDTPYKFVLASLIENKDGSNSLELIKDLRDKDVNLALESKLKGYTNIIVDAIKKEYGYKDDRGNDKRIDGIRNEIYYGEYLHRIKISNNFDIGENVFGTIYYNEKDKILEFYDDNTEITNKNYQYLFIIMKEIEVNKIWFRGERTFLRGLDNKNLPDLIISIDSLLFIDGCSNLDISLSDINNIKDAIIHIEKSKNINISGITISDMTIENSTEVIIDNEVNALINLERSSDISFGDGIRTVRIIKDCNDININNSLTDLKIMSIDGEVRDIYLSSKENLTIDEKQLDKIVDIHFEDEEDYDGIDLDYVRNESIADEIISKKLKSSLNLLEKIKKV